MQKKHLISLLFFVLLISVPFLSLIKPVHATDYNWLENEGFEDATRIIANGNFELGNQSWTIEHSSTDGALDDYPYEGNYYMRLGDLGNGIYQTLENNVTIANITDISFFAEKSSASSSITYITISWENDTGLHSTTDTFALTEDYDLYFFDLDSIDDDGNGWIYYIYVYYGGGNGYQRIDNIVFYIEGIGITNGQTDIDDETEPWKSNWELVGGEDGYIGITSDEANNGYYSGYLTYSTSSYNEQMEIIQDINYLLVDNFTGISVYIKTDSASNIAVKCSLQYSDLTVEVDILNTEVNSTSGWVLCNFTDYSGTGKSIISVHFNVYGGDYGDRTYFDDIELNAEIESTTGSLFEWYMIPEVEKSSSYSCLAYIETNYVFYGTFYNGTGYAEDSGTFSVTHDLGTVSGTISYGQFNFDIVARGTTYENKAEYFTITLSIDEKGSYVFKIRISWTDIYTDYEGDEDEMEQRQQEENINFIYWLIYFIFLIVPAISFASALKSKDQDPIIGGVCGLLLSSYLLYRIDGSLFGTVICIVAVIALIFGRRSGYV